MNWKEFKNQINELALDDNDEVSSKDGIELKFTCKDKTSDNYNDELYIGDMIEFQNLKKSIKH